MPHMVPSVTGLRIVRPWSTAIAEHHLATASDHVRNVRRLGPECVSVAQEGSVPGGTMPHLGGALSGRIAAHGPVLASASRIRGAGVCIVGRAPVGAGCRTCQGCDATSGRCHIWSLCHIWASASHEGVFARGACDQVGWLAHCARVQLSKLVESRRAQRPLLRAGPPGRRRPRGHGIEKFSTQRLFYYVHQMNTLYSYRIRHLNSHSCGLSLLPFKGEQGKGLNSTFLEEFKHWTALLDLTSATHH